MKNYILFTYLMIAFNFASAQTPENNEIKIQIKGIEKPVGFLRLRIMDDQKKVVLFQKIPVTESEMALTFQLKNGTYAVSLYQDENSNEKLDTGIFGIPKELYGFSNDAKGKFGPPEFADQLFAVNSNKSMTINLSKPF